MDNLTTGILLYDITINMLNILCFVGLFAGSHRFVYAFLRFYRIYRSSPSFEQNERADNAALYSFIVLRTKREAGANPSKQLAPKRIDWRIWRRMPKG